MIPTYPTWLPRWHSGKESASQDRRQRRRGSNPWVRKIPWRRKSQPIPVFLPGKFHGQKSPEDYSPWRCKELATTEQMHTHTALPFYYNASTPPLCTHLKHYCYQASFCQENLRFILWRS